jgi:hypothetical protein
MAVNRRLHLHVPVYFHTTKIGHVRYFEFIYLLQRPSRRLVIDNQKLLSFSISMCSVCIIYVGGDYIIMSYVCFPTYDKYGGSGNAGSGEILCNSIQIKISHDDIATLGINVPRFTVPTLILANTMKLERICRYLRCWYLRIYRQL